VVLALLAAHHIFHISRIKVKNDVKLMGAKRWRKKAEGRSVWAIILKEALVKLKNRMPEAKQTANTRTINAAKSTTDVSSLGCPIT
jgi:hypothetical protein